MIRTFTGTTDGSELHIGIAAARWNQDITDRLVAGAVGRLEGLGVTEITVVEVAGALELPIAARALASDGCDAVVAIGTVIKGDTDHYEIVVRESSSGLTRVALDTGVPVTNAILAVHEYEQALERAGTGMANKGFEAAEAAVTTITALRRLEKG